MSQTERLTRIREWLVAGRCVSAAELQHALEVSIATLKRDVRFLRDRLNMPVVWDRERGGWALDPGQSPVGTQYELPGLWLNAEEIHALLTMQHLLASLDGGGLLHHHIAPLMQRLAQVMADAAPPQAEMARRIRLLTVGARRYAVPYFQAVGSALLRRQRLRIRYHARSDDRIAEREVSPQRLVHYRDNWYLDAWCHRRQALRSFSVDALLAVDVLDSAAIEVPDGQLDDQLAAGYGIFAGNDIQWARLRFSARRARWVSAERWHPHQRGDWDDQGRWCLQVPYADPRELVMDILRHVPDVQVLDPPELREQVLQRLRQGISSWGVDE